MSFLIKKKIKLLIKDKQKRYQNCHQFFLSVNLWPIKALGREYNAQLYTRFNLFPRRILVIKD